MDIDTHSDYAVDGRIMLICSVLVFVVVLFLLIFQRRIHRCFRRLLRNHLLSTTVNNRSGSTSTVTSGKNEGLDSSILKKLPIFTYAGCEILQECVVCLSDFQDKDRARFLPCCNNTFHTFCIDIWFRSNSTCPLCRAEVYPPEGPVQPPKGFSAEPLGCSGSFPQPIWCPRKPSGLVSIVVEVPVVAGDDVLREPVDVGAGAPGENSVKHHR